MRSLVLFSLLFMIANNAWSDTKRELRCLALNVYHEARGEPVEGQLAVALVTMNRVHSKSYPDQVCKVVWQRRQFSWTHDGRSDSPRDKKAWQMANKIASFVYQKYDEFHGLSGGALDITQGALHYYAPKHADPSWARVKEVTNRIGGHIFLKAKKKHRS